MFGKHAAESLSRQGQWHKSLVNAALCEYLVKLQGVKYKPASLKMPIDEVTNTGILNYKSETSKDAI